jgi:hypothetical protein
MIEPPDNENGVNGDTLIDPDSAETERLPAEISPCPLITDELNETRPPPVIGASRINALAGSWLNETASAA